MKYERHGMKNHHLYSVWKSMKERCNNPKTNRYKYYGLKGISVCARWNKFSGFFADMGASYSQGLTLDRLNNNKNYCKSNCKWSSPKEQARNRSSNIRIKFNNKVKILITWCEELGIDYNKTWQIIFRYNWSIEKAFSLKK